MVDLDSNPTKLLEIVEIGKQLLITRGSLTTFSIANDVAKYFAIIPAMFVATYPELGALNVMRLATPQSAILSEVQKYDGLQSKNHIDTIDMAISARMNSTLASSPFEIIAALVSDIRYPEAVANAVAQKIAATQVLEQKTTEIQITVKEAEKREKEAEGFAHAMATIKGQLTPEYLQYEAIKAQLAMVSSPNHSVMYIPVGPMGVPLVGTIDMSKVPPSSR